MKSRRHTVDHRAVVENAWLRSEQRGTATSVDLDLIPRTPVDPDTSLFRSTEDALRDVSIDMEDVTAGLIVTDSSGIILDTVAGSSRFTDALIEVRAVTGMDYSERVLGANAVGTAIEAGLPVRFRGAEHYNESMRKFSCVAVPVQNPDTRRTMGVVNMCAPVAADGILSGLFVSTVARQIAQRYANRAVEARNVLYARYLQARERYGSVVAFSDDSVFASYEALCVLSRAEVRALQEMWLQHRSIVEVALPPGVEVADSLGGPDGSGIIFWVTRSASVSAPSGDEDGALTQASSLQRIDVIERDAVIRALRATQGNKAAAAAWLGVSRRTMYNKIAQLRIARVEYDAPEPSDARR
jgi:transcriptional regulator of acetoin/glycerol metabolism